MSRYEYEYDDENDDLHERMDDDHGGTSDDGARTTSQWNGDSAHGYRFVITNGTVTGITEYENGRAQQEQMEYGETWTVSGDRVIKTEIEHGFIQTAIYTDPDGDGVFTKASQTYVTQAPSGTVSTAPVNSIQGGLDTDDNWSGSPGADHYYGSVGNDSLHGAQGDDDLYGGNDDDDLYGDDGDDHLYGSNGNDHLHGGSGVDDAYYTGTRAEYALSPASAGVQLTDTHSLRDGTDLLESVERIHFSDVSLALDTDGVSGKAYRLYKAAFDREPDLPGLGHWIAQLDKGTDLTAVAQAFMASEEFQHLYGSKVSDEEFVHLLYRNALDRVADAGGHANWVAQLQGPMTRAQVLVHFSESDENQGNVAGLIANGIAYQEWIG